MMIGIIGYDLFIKYKNKKTKIIINIKINLIMTLAEYVNFNERLLQNHNFYVSALNDKHSNGID
jgi:hypothetical protein